MRLRVLAGVVAGYEASIGVARGVQNCRPMEFLIESKMNGQVIEVRGGDRNAGAGLVVGPRTGAAGQRWTLVRAGEDCFYLTSALHGYVVDIGGGDTSPAASLIAYPRNEPRSDNQLWRRVETGDGWFYLESKLHGFVVDIRGGGTDLIAYPRNEPRSDNQLWQMTPAPEMQASVREAAATSGPQALEFPAGSRVFVVCTTQSAALQTVTILGPEGAPVFGALGVGDAGGALTVIGQGSFVAAAGAYTVMMTEGAGLLRGGETIVHAGGPRITTHVLASNDGGAEAGDRDFNDLVVTIQVYATVG